MVDGVRMNGAGPAERAVRAAIAVDRLPVAPVQFAEPSAITSLTTPASLASQGAPVDISKLAAIRSAIVAGTYRVDPDAIASAMIKADLQPD